MSLTHDRHRVVVAGTEVAIDGAMGPVQPTWTLSLDGVEVDRAKASGNFSLRGELRDGTKIRVWVEQSLLGPTEVRVQHDDTEVALFSGFVA